MLHTPEFLQTTLLHKVVAKNDRKNSNKKKKFSILRSNCSHCWPRNPDGQIHKPVYGSQIPWL